MSILTFNNTQGYSGVRVFVYSDSARTTLVSTHPHLYTDVAGQDTITLADGTYYYTAGYGAHYPLQGTVTVSGDTTEDITLVESTEFVSSWKTDNVGTSNNDQITLPLISGGSYNFVVNWGDGNSDTITAWDDAAKTHTYATAGTYTVTITGTIDGWVFDGVGDKDKLLEITSWGPLDLLASQDCFEGCGNLILTNVDDVLKARTTHHGIVRSCASLTTIQYLYLWDTSGSTDMNTMFYSCSRANPDVSGFDTSRVTTMRSMFHNCYEANPDVSGFDTSQVTKMGYMFSTCSGANPDVSGFDTSQVTDMSAMFNLSNWSTENYNKALLAWAKQTLQSGVSFGANSTQYKLGAPADARQYLIDTYTWDITDAGATARHYDKFIMAGGQYPMRYRPAFTAP